MANIEISCEVLDRIESEATRRDVSLADVLAELADALPTVRADDDRATPAFVGAGSSGAGIGNRIDELLADGFGRS
jgi:hypothetical protein